MIPQPIIQQKTERIIEFQQDWFYCTGGWTFCIKRGFLSDGYSVPWPFWWVIRPGSFYGPAGLHDALSESRGRSHHMLDVWLRGMRFDLDLQPFTMLQVNELFRDCMRDSGIKPERSWAVKTAVNIHLARRWNTSPTWTQDVIRKHIEEREAA